MRIPNSLSVCLRSVPFRAAPVSMPLPPMGPTQIPNPPRDQTRQEASGEKKEVVGVLVSATTVGATIGTACLGPGVGTVVGAAGGAICGLVGSWFLAKNNEDARRRR